MTTLLALSPVILSALANIPSVTSSAELTAYSEGQNQAFPMSQSPTAADVVFETEDAPINAICYVEEKSAKALSSVGYPIEKEPKTGLYFYKATKGTPKIKSAKIASEDLGSLTSRILRIEGDVIAKNILVTPNPIPSNVNKTVLGYLRSFNTHYVEGMDSLADGLGGGLEEWIKKVGKEFVKGISWAAIAGKVDPAYTRNQDLALFNWKFIYKYFSHYVEEANWSDTYHNAYDHTPDGSSSWFFLDPIPRNPNDASEKSAGIDLIHFFASIDGGYKLMSTIDTAWKYPLSKSLGALSSWAGDLQSTAAYYASHNFPDSGKPLDILSHESSEPDLLADMDAINILSSHLKGPGFLHDAINSYYGSTKCMYKRCWSFIENLAGEISFKKFEDTVYSYLGVTMSCGSWVSTEEYNDADNPKFLIIKSKLYADGGVDTPEKRVKVAKAFIDYVEQFTDTSYGC